jgi:pyruvate dehydrogenase E2 component (dihydrolipoamide acetyltransferase)
MNLTLTADHRVMDGLQAARFLVEVKERIEKPYFLIA